MRFFFAYRGRRTPSGGHKQCRLMVSLLNQMGEQAYLLVDGTTSDGDLYRVHPPEAPFPWQEAASNLTDDDVVVLPEGHLPHYLALTAGWRCRKAVNSQNAFYALQFRPAGSYPANGIEFAIVNSPFVAAVTVQRLGLSPERVFLVPHWVTREPFDPDEDGHRMPRRLAVCYMPRKLPEHIQRVRALVALREPDVPWIEIDRQPESDVAGTLRAHAIFFSSQDTEGCPLPSLEAMACGCLVAGYPGTRSFPHPYATPQNGLWAPDRSIREAAARVREAIGVARAGGAELAALLAAGRVTAGRYDREAVRTALDAVVRRVRARSYGGDGQTEPGLDWKTRVRLEKLVLGMTIHRWRARLTG